MGLLIAQLTGRPLKPEYVKRLHISAFWAAEVHAGKQFSSDVHQHGRRYAGL